MTKGYRMVEVHREGKTYERRQPLHHKISKKTAEREVKRLDSEIEGLEKRKMEAMEREEAMA